MSEEVAYVYCISRKAMGRLNIFQQIFIALENPMLALISCVRKSLLMLPPLCTKTEIPAWEIKFIFFI